MTTRVLFRADGGSTVGAGHMQRCRALAQALVSSGANCAFASTPESRAMLPQDAIRQFSWNDVAPGDNAEAIGRSVGGSVDWLVVDHYGLGDEFERPARRWAKKIMVVDDVPLRRHDCDLLLDQNQTDEKSWRGLVPPAAAVLAGPRYALLRREIADAMMDNRHAGSRAVLTLGAADPHHITERLLPAVKQALPPSWTLDVIAGPANIRCEVLQDMCGKLGAAFHHAPRDLAAIFARASIAITAGGSTCWEFAALGVPMVIVVESDDQRKVAATVTGAGAGVPAGDCDRDIEQRLARAVRDLAADPQRQEQMSRAGRRLVDGEGPRRVAEVMLASIRKAS